MTRDEVRELIVNAIDQSTQLIDFGDFTVTETDFDAASEAVLAAFAARGIVLGVMEDIEVDIWPEDGEIPLPDGYALVRVVE